jgi:uncharacterized membrane protein YraQ (UPF0718 family)
MIIAMFAGILTNLFDTEEHRPTASNPKDTTGVADTPSLLHIGVGKKGKQSMPSSFSAAAPRSTSTFSMHAPRQETSSETGEGSTDTAVDKAKQGFSLPAVLRYAFVTLLGDIAKPLLWGLLLGALITVAIPEDLAALLQDHTWLSYLIVIVIAVPMYVCATASLPIAAGLMLSGVSAGAAFVFLSAGPATNTVTIGVVKKMLGSRSLAIYLGSITLGSILFGLGLDYIFDTSAIDPTSLIQLDEEGGTVAIISSILLWGLVLYHISRPYFDKKDTCNGETYCA